MKKTLIVTASLSLLGLFVYALITQNNCSKTKNNNKRKQRPEKLLAMGNFPHIEDDHLTKKPFRNNNRDAANRK